MVHIEKWNLAVVKEFWFVVFEVLNINSFILLLFPLLIKVICGPDFDYLVVSCGNKERVVNDILGT
jgi:hypothetical protein